VATLEIETHRLNPDTKMVAQNERELLMKEQFLTHFRNRASSQAGSKVLLRFGRNHLHRGYDARGISTLGNFIVEFAIAQGKKAFNVGVFGAGGKEAMGGEPFDADERQDELAFTLLAERQSTTRPSSTCAPFAPCCTGFHKTNDLCFRSI
jgi:hypothetical protein